MITSLSPEQEAWLLGYCHKHDLPADLAFADHCAQLAADQGIVDLDYTRKRAIEQVKTAQWRLSQQVIAGQRQK